MRWHSSHSAFTRGPRLHKERYWHWRFSQALTTMELFRISCCLYGCLMSRRRQCVALSDHTFGAETEKPWVKLCVWTTGLRLRKKGGDWTKEVTEILRRWSVLIGTLGKGGFLWIRHIQCGSSANSSESHFSGKWAIRALSCVGISEGSQGRRQSWRGGVTLARPC